MTDGDAAPGRPWFEVFGFAGRKRLLERVWLDGGHEEPTVTAIVS